MKNQTCARPPHFWCSWAQTSSVCFGLLHCQLRLKLLNLSCASASTQPPPHQICLLWVRSNLSPTMLPWGEQAGRLLWRSQLRGEAPHRNISLPSSTVPQCWDRHQGIHRWDLALWESSSLGSGWQGGQHGALSWALGFVLAGQPTSAPQQHESEGREKGEAVAAVSSSLMDGELYRHCSSSRGA